MSKLPPNFPEDCEEFKRLTLMAMEAMQLAAQDVAEENRRWGLPTLAGENLTRDLELEMARVAEPSVR